MRLETHMHYELFRTETQSLGLGTCQTKICWYSNCELTALLCYQEVLGLIYFYLLESFVNLNIYTALLKLQFVMKW